MPRLLQRSTLRTFGILPLILLLDFSVMKLAKTCANILIILYIFCISTAVSIVSYAVEVFQLRFSFYRFKFYRFKSSFARLNIILLSQANFSLSDHPVCFMFARTAFELIFLQYG